MSVAFPTTDHNITTRKEVVTWNTASSPVISPDQPQTQTTKGGGIMRYRKFNGYCQFNAGNGWRFTHRTAARNKLGRSIPVGHHVHHVNGNKTDNRHKNLVILPGKIHRLIHMKL